MKTLKEKIEIMQAKLDGEEIEWITLNDSNGSWDLYVNDAFNWTDFDYRVKPKPMEIWVNVYEAEDSSNCGFNAYSTKGKALRSFGSAGKTVKFIQAPDDKQ